MRKNKLVTIIMAAISLLPALGLFAGCASGPSAKSSGGEGKLSVFAASAFPKESQLDSFAKEGLRSLSSFELSNGIPVVVRKNSASPIRHISLVLRGGASAATLDTAGYENLALAVMARGSRNYSYEQITAALEDMSAGLGPDSSGTIGMDCSLYTLNVLDKYYDKIFPIWTDTLTEPTFDQKDFDQVLSDAKLAWTSAEKNPWSRMSHLMNASFFEGHPYAAAPDGLKDSLDKATLDAIKSWYDKSFSSDRIFIVAAGDFDVASLRADLEKSLGKIPDKHVGYPKDLPPTGGVAKKLQKIEHPQSRGLAYIRGDFYAPSMADPDYMATGIAMKMYDGLLFDNVREQNGAAYGANAYIRSTKSNYGSIAIFKTTMAAKIKGFIDQATDEFKAGKCLSPEDTGEGKVAERVPIEDAIASYKAQFKNSYYEDSQTNSEVAKTIIRSVIQTGDCRTWLLDGQKIDAVTADQVKAAAKKYIFDGKIVWIAVGSADTLVGLTEADYEKLGN